MNNFDKIIGYANEKEEMMRLCDVLKNSEKYIRLGVKIPKAVLLYGDPGLGKTLMAKAFIGETGRKVFHCKKNKSNGEFVTEIKKTFEYAIQATPSIIFFDDMDKFAEDNLQQNCNKEEFVAIQAGLEDIVEQLQEYTEDLGDNELIGATYTGIKSVLNTNDTKNVTNRKNNKSIEWKFRSYKQIAEKLVQITNNSTSQIIKERKCQIIEYCNIVLNISNLLESSLEATNDVLCYDAKVNLADERVRLDDVFKKLKGADFLSYIRKRKDELEQLCPQGKGYHFACWQSYNNKHATLDIRFSSWSKDCSSYFDIGIQIEEMQYRRMALVDGQTVRKFNSHKPTEAFFESLAVNDWFDNNFEPKGNERVIWDKTTKLKKKFDSYSTSQYCFIYQYCNIDEVNENVRYEDLFNCIKADLLKAKQIIEKRF